MNQFIRTVKLKLLYCGYANIYNEQLTQYQKIVEIKQKFKELKTLEQKLTLIRAIPLFIHLTSSYPPSSANLDLCPSSQRYSQQGVSYYSMPTGPDPLRALMSHLSDNKMVFLLSFYQSAAVQMSAGAIISHELFMLQQVNMAYRGSRSPRRPSKGIPGRLNNTEIQSQGSPFRIIIIPLKILGQSKNPRFHNCW